MNEQETTRQCDQCGREYHARTNRSRYCSGACRAKHSRAEHGAIVDDRSLAVRRTIATRSQQMHEGYCAMCGAVFTYTGNGRRRVYCSAVCRKRAFNAAHNEPIEEIAADEHDATVDRVNNSADVLVDLFVGSMTMQQIIFAAGRVTEQRLAPQEGRARHPNTKSIPRYAA